jgi:hypothetical protein
MFSLGKKKNEILEGNLRGEIWEKENCMDFHVSH